MTVFDLIHKLWEMPADAVVHLCIEDFNYAPIESVVHRDNDDGGEPGVVLLKLERGSEIGDALRDFGKNEWNSE